MKIPYLGEKLKILYASRRNPDVTNDSQLAQMLGVARSTVSSWKTGSGGMTAEAVPDEHFRPLCEIFGVDAVAFLNPSLGRFETHAQPERSGWTLLLRASELDSGALRIERENDGMRGIAWQQRPNDRVGEVLALGTAFRLAMRVPADSLLLLLLQDPTDVQCIDLRAALGQNSFRAPATEFFVPALKFSPYVTTDTIGAHCWLVVMEQTQTPWRESLIDDLLAAESAVDCHRSRCRTKDDNYSLKRAVVASSHAIMRYVTEVV